MLYKFDKHKMNFVIATRTYLRMIYCLLLGSIISFIIITCMQTEKLNSIKYITEETRMLVINQENEFSEVKLKEYIIGLNIRFQTHYPHKDFAIFFCDANILLGHSKIM